MAAVLKYQTLPPVKLIRNVPKEEYYVPGHRTCAGCGPAEPLLAGGGAHLDAREARTQAQDCFRV